MKLDQLLECAEITLWSRAGSPNKFIVRIPGLVHLKKHEDLTEPGHGAAQESHIRLSAKDSAPDVTLPPRPLSVVMLGSFGTKELKEVNMLKDFKAFILKGNVLDLAVAVIIGAAFGAIVSSLVNDILMPPIGLLLSGVDFKELFVSLNGQSYPTLAAAKAAAAPVIAYGLFLNAMVNFLIIAFVIFLVVKMASKLQKPVVATAPATKDCVYCCTPMPILAKRCPHCTSTVPA
jgi:large conductance mechanosensitive channel